MVPYKEINIDAPVVDAFRRVGLIWMQYLVAAGAMTGITSVLLVMMLSQPRVMLALARDGLVPKGFFGDIHPKFRTPWKSTILTGLFVAAMAGFIPLSILAEMTSIGTLFAFVIVCGAVLVMRRTNPNANRPFRAPFVPLVPILGILTCLLLMFSLPAENWYRLIIWLIIGLVIYFLYGRRHSVMANKGTLTMRLERMVCRPQARPSAFPMPLRAVPPPLLIRDGKDQTRNDEDEFGETLTAFPVFPIYGFQFLFRCGGPWSWAPAGLLFIAFVLGSSCLVSLGGSMRTFLA